MNFRTAQEAIDSFRDLCVDIPIPPTVGEKGRHQELLLKAFEAGIWWAALRSVKGQELSALTALLAAVTKGFEAGCAIRSNTDEDAILDAKEVE